MAPVRAKKKGEMKIESKCHDVDENKAMKIGVSSVCHDVFENKRDKGVLPRCA